MTHSIIIKRPGEPAEVMEIEATYRCDLTPLLGRNITPSYCHLCQRNDIRRLCLVCDEDGRYKDLPANFDLVTFGVLGNYYVPLKGAVVFFKYIWEPSDGKEIYDYKLTSISDRDIALVEYILGDEYQKKAKEYAHSQNFCQEGGLL